LEALSHGIVTVAKDVCDK